MYQEKNKCHFVYAFPYFSVLIILWTWKAVKPEWVLEIAPNTHWVSRWVSKLITTIFFKIKYQVWIYNNGYQKIKYPVIVCNHSSQFFWEKSNIHIVNCWVFGSSSMNLAWNQCSLLLNFFKYPKLMGITKIKYPPHTGLNS